MRSFLWLVQRFGHPGRALRFTVFLLLFGISHSLGATEAHAGAPPTYTWQEGSWSPCSATCGGGIRTRSVVCVDQNGMPVSDSFCDPPKPPTSEQCNTQPCAVYGWVTGPWGECSETCGSGTQTRTVECKDLNSGTTVSDGFCDPPKPPAQQACNEDPCQPVPAAGGFARMLLVAVTAAAGALALRVRRRNR